MAINSDKFDELRKRAEKLLKSSNVEPQNLSSQNILHLIQELHIYIYQIELELQNEELCRTQEQLEESRNKYFELYDIAPVGYFTLDKNCASARKL